jgi:DNA-binding MarR family transcriptional regulator
MRDESEGVGAWSALLRAHAAVVPKLAVELRRAGLPIAWYDVLLVLNAAPGRRLKMTELGRSAVLSRERVSRVVRELEAEGLVERVSNPDDGRSWYAGITQEGRRRLRKAAPTYLAGIEEHFTRHMSQAEVRAVAKALGRVVENEE